MTGACPCCGQPLPSDDLLILPDRRTISRGGRSVIIRRRMLFEMVQLLAERAPRCVRRPSIMDHLYQLQPDEPDIKILDVFVCRLRREVAPLGVKIVTHWGVGFSLKVEGLSRIVTEDAA